MNLFQKLQDQARAGSGVRAGLIGAGKFGSMFLSQIPSTPGLHVTAIADLDTDRAKRALTDVGWPSQLISKTTILDNGGDLVTRDDVDVVIEATGNPAAGIAHAIAAIEAGKHIIMVNVEADVLAGPALAKRARDKGVVYSLAYGDQPALVCEMVDWARAIGMEVVCAGKGTKYLPAYHHVTPDDVWSHYGLDADEAADAGMNAQMFNSFLDGTKSAIEMAAIANATGLSAPRNGLAFPPCGVDDLADMLRPRADGGILQGTGMVETISSLKRNGNPVFRDLRWGVYCVFRAPNEYAAQCFRQYGLLVDDTGTYAAMHKPYHLIGMELGISVLSAALRGEATGAPRAFKADVAAIAKRDLQRDEVLDGEGGYTVWGKILPAATSLAESALPIGLAQGVKLKRDIPRGQTLTFRDVDIDYSSQALKIRAETEALVV